MASRDDINRFGEKERNALKRVEKSRENGDIDARDAEDIRKYGIGAGDLSPSTMKDRLGHLRILAEESDFDIPLLDHSPHQIHEVLYELEGEREWSDGTKRNYEKSVRAFYKFHGDEDKAEEIDLTKTESPKFRENSIVLLDEIRAMIDTVENVRDRALLATMWEGAYRITALLSLKKGDYKPQGDEYAVIKTPDVEGMKGAEGREKPVTWARAYLDNWLAEHPVDEPDAPLFCSYKNNEETKGDSLTPQYVRKLVRKAAKTADGVDGEKIHPHSFRHGRATYLARNDYSDREIEHLMDWTRDTAQHERYEHLVQQDKVDSILRRTGVELEEEQEREEDSMECPRCGNRILVGSQYCPQCSLRLNDEKPPWLRVYQSAVDDSMYLEELTSNPCWNIAELRPELYEHVSEVVTQALFEAQIPDELEPPADWEWQYPDLDIDSYEAEELAEEIFGGLPWEGDFESFSEHYSNFPGSAARKEKQDPFYERGMSAEEYLDILPDGFELNTGEKDVQGSE